MTMVQSIAVLTFAYVVGIMVSKFTGGRVPSTLATIPVMFAIFWSGFMTVEDVAASGFGTVYNIMMTLILVNVGSTFDVKMVVKQWKLVLLCLGALAGCAALTFTIGQALWGRDMMVASYPVLAGGAIASAMMQEACNAKGMGALAGIVALVATVQGWLSMPLISNMVRVESKRLLKIARENGGVIPTGDKNAEEEAPAKPKLFDRLPAKFETPYLHLLVCAVLGVIAEKIAGITSPMTGGIVGTAVVGILVGMIARAFGLVSKDPLTKATLMPLFTMVLCMWTRRNLANLSPAGLLAAVGPILGCVLLGAVGLCAVGIVVGKFAGMSVPMSILVAIQAYSGYPINQVITNEVIDFMTEDAAEREMLRDNMISKIVLGGVISVSISSVIIAGAFVNIL